MKLNVISFNIRCANDENGHSIPERAPRLANVTSNYDADVIGFQEYIPQWDSFIEKYYLENYDMFLKYRAESSLEGCPILWKKDKFECLDKGYFWLSDTPEVESSGWDSWGCHRICEYVILKEKSTGKTFNFMNTHFGFSDKCQVDSAKLIYEYSKKISDYPTFIVGDFNMTPTSLGYKEMVKHFRDVNTLTVNDLTTTYHGYKPDEITDAHIDFCFIDENIKPINQKLMTETFNGKYPSDHYGVFAELDI